MRAGSNYVRRVQGRYDIRRHAASDKASSSVRRHLICRSFNEIRRKESTYINKAKDAMHFRALGNAALAHEQDTGTKWTALHTPLSAAIQLQPRSTVTARGASYRKTESSGAGRRNISTR